MDICNRITQADVARAVGCSQVTVSRALNDDCRVSDDLKTRIKEAAAELGYRPDPMLRALAASRRFLSAKSVNASIAFVYAGHRPRPDVIFSNYEYYQGVQNRAQELGFALETLRFDANHDNPLRFENILHHRGVKGVVFALSSGHHIFSEPLFRLPRFASVMLGYNFSKNPVNCIMPDSYNAINLAIRKAFEAGYRRIGLAVSETQNIRIEFAYTDGFRRVSAELGTGGEEMIHLVKHRTPEEIDAIPVALDRWLNATRPEIVIGTLGTRVHLLKILPSRNQKIGADLPFICLDIRRRVNGDDSGLYGNRYLMGERAVENLAAQIVRNKVGLPQYYERTLVQSRWQEGNTYQRSKTHRDVA